MKPLDGNTIAGALFERFGAELTTARGSCAHCQASVIVAELRVYTRAPGTIVRCPSWANVVIVLVSIRNEPTVELSAFQLLETQPPFRGMPRPPV